MGKDKSKDGTGKADGRDELKITNDQLGENSSGMGRLEKAAKDDRSRRNK